MGQQSIISLGMLAGTLLAGYRVAEGRLTAGDFVQFITYLNQLYSPLNWFGTYWRYCVGLHMRPVPL
jgi:ATP-binding cassette subfamily B (MDR/TAP) protein 6